MKVMLKVNENDSDMVELSTRTRPFLINTLAVIHIDHFFGVIADELEKNGEAEVEIKLVEA